MLLVSDVRTPEGELCEQEGKNASSNLRCSSGRHIGQYHLSKGALLHRGAERLFHGFSLENKQARKPKWQLSPLSGQRLRESDNRAASRQWVRSAAGAARRERCPASPVVRSSPHASGSSPRGRGAPSDRRRRLPLGRAVATGSRAANAGASFAPLRARRRSCARGPLPRFPLKRALSRPRAPSRRGDAERSLQPFESPHRTSRASLRRRPRDLHHAGVPASPRFRRAAGEDAHEP